VTQDVADFPDIAQRWAGAGRAHAGLIVLLGIDHGEFGVITRTVGRELARRAQQQDWADVTIFAGRY
jgi:hypothetical protein